ncbi:MAG: CheB methylesterase domain-containing protein [Turicibacter sp.]|nr:CheB methylesterase domain-containing protein [Turicibacter sp.]
MLGATRFVIVSRDPLFCLCIKEGLKHFANIEMVLNVSSPQEAENKIVRKISNVILLDVDTTLTEPTFVQRMVRRFDNVLVVFTAAKEITAKKYMSVGLRDFAHKPQNFNQQHFHRYLQLILSRVGDPVKSVGYKDVARVAGLNDKIIAIASSTGGVEALEQVIKVLPADIPPILSVQHMPSGFTKLFAERLDGIYPQKIKEAVSGDLLLRGQILIAPAGSHMQLVKKQDKFAVECFIGPKMHGVIPAADILFESVANIVRRNAVGVVLTGMGADGARGLMLMHNNGAKTIIQNEATCVVFGMPKVARDLGAVDFELPIDRIGAKIMEFA